MSSRKIRGAKVLPETLQMDSPNLSAVDKESFMEGLQRNSSNPLHSTAVEEDLNVLEEGQVSRRPGGRRKMPKTAETDGKQRGAAGKRKVDDEEEEAKRKRSRKSPEVKSKSSSGRDGPAGGLEGRKKRAMKSSDQPVPTEICHPVGEKPARRASSRLTSAARSEKRQQLEDEETEPPSDMSGDGRSEEEGDSGRVQKQRRRVLSSDEDMDEDTSWKQSPQKARMPSWGRTGKSSSQRSRSRKSSAGEAERAGSDKRRPAGRGATDMEVVLDAFLQFCDQYRECVESPSVQRSIRSFSSNVEEQLLEKISSCKELKVLKRENKKVGSLIRKKTQRLLDAKRELMRAERSVSLLQKEKAELQQRLSDVKRGRAFLHDISQLNRKYLDHRRRNPTEKETYGASSQLALLLETKLIHPTELQPSGINKQLEKRQKTSGSQK